MMMMRLLTEWRSALPKVVNEVWVAASPFAAASAPSDDRAAPGGLLGRRCSEGGACRALLRWELLLLVLAQKSCEQQQKAAC
jgi:hypothetical protein